MLDQPLHQTVVGTAPTVDPEESSKATNETRTQDTALKWRAEND